MTQRTKIFLAVILAVTVVSTLLVVWLNRRKLIQIGADSTASLSTTTGNSTTTNWFLRSVNPTSGSAPLLVTMTLGADPLIVKGRGVDWGDGSATVALDDQVTTASHTYSSAGTFTVTLNGSPTGRDCFALPLCQQPVKLGTASVTVTTASTSNDLSISPTNGPVPLSVKATLTVHPGVIAGRTLDWGDGSATASLDNAATSTTHTYASAGTFTAMLKGYNTAVDCAVSNNTCPPLETLGNATVTVTGQSLTTITPTSGAASLTVTATFPKDPGIPPATDTVDWGDGSTVGRATASATTSTTLSHTYTTVGTYSVTGCAQREMVLNTCPAGSTSSLGTVTVTAPSSSDLSLSPTSGIVPVSVTATFKVHAGVIVGRTLDWGDGSATASLDNAATSATHTYSAAGTYIAVLKGYNSAVDCAVSNNTCPPLQTLGQATVTVTNSFIRDVRPTSGTTPVAVTMTLTADPLVVTQRTVDWGDASAVVSLDDQTTTTSHTYSTAGSYTVRLKGVASGRNCVDSIACQQPVQLGTATVTVTAASASDNTATSSQSATSSLAPSPTPTSSSNSTSSTSTNSANSIASTPSSADGIIDSVTKLPIATVHVTMWRRTRNNGRNKIFFLKGDSRLLTDTQPAGTYTHILVKASGYHSHSLPSVTLKQPASLLKDTLALKPRKLKK